MKKTETGIEHNHKATDVSFDLSKQFISLAFAGVAFAVGLSAANGSIASTVLFWVTIVLFSGSALLGFLFMMRGAASIAKDGQFDIFETASRSMAIIQVVSVFAAVVLLLILHVQSGTKPSRIPTPSEGLRIDNKGMVIEYSVNQRYDISVKADGAFEVKSSTAEPSDAAASP